MGATGKLQGIVAELEARIDRGRLVSGQRLVEADLTREFGISRALLREAFRQLAAEGAIELVPNRGAEVRRLSRQEALELFEIRAEIEGMAARRAAHRMDDKDARAAFAAATAPHLAENGTPGALEYIAGNEAFHRAVMIASGNGMAVELARRMRLPLIMSQLREALCPEVLAASRTEHAAITAAILDADPAAAEAAMRAHLDRAISFVTTVPARLFRD